MIELKNALRTVEQSLYRVAATPEPQDTSLDIEVLANKALRPLIPQIRNWLASNYSGSGLSSGNKRKDKRGAAGIAEALKSAMVWIVLRNDQLILRFGLPAGLDERTYLAAAALNYGSVTAPHRDIQQVDIINRGYQGYKKSSVIGKRGKQTIKKHALAGTQLPKKSANYWAQEAPVAATVPGFQYRRNNRGKVSLGQIPNKQEGDGSIKLGGGVTVRKPHQFFRLTDSQTKEIAGKIFDALKSTGEQ